MTLTEEEGRDHGDDTISNRPTHNGPSTAFRTHIQREDFRRIKPGCREPTGAERCSVCDFAVSIAYLRGVVEP